MVQDSDQSSTRPMHATPVVLVTRDESLRANVAAVVSQIDRLRLEVVPELATALARARHESFALVMFHLAHTSADRCTCHMISQFNCLTLVISDDFRPSEAVRLLKQGTADYLTRPLNLRRLAYLLDSLTQQARQGAGSNVAQRGKLMSLSREHPFLFSAGEMERIISQIQKLAPLETTILLCGETGTGKTHLAKLIHELSPRRKRPFVSVDCGALAWCLLESEMFGHAKGSFTSADRSTTGKLTSAGCGTLVIEEIDVVPLQLQAKFLRAVEERVYQPVGSSQELPLQARLIVTTNQSLAEEVAAGRFRSDLYHRINVVSFQLPPLRTRRAMIPALAGQFVSDVAQQQNRSPPVFSQQAMRLLQSYDWPGNIRELRNVTERCVALAPNGVIEVDVFPPELQQLDEPSELEWPLAEEDPSRFRRAKQSAEARVIRDALVDSGNNRAEAARLLGISRVTLYKKLRVYGLL